MNTLFGKLQMSFNKQQNMSSHGWKTFAASTGSRAKCVCIFLSSYLSCLSFKVDVFPRRNLSLITVEVGWEELEREVGARRYEGLQTERQ